MLKPEYYTFSELETEFYRIRNNYPARNIWNLIKEFPIDNGAINILVNMGWKVTPGYYRSLCVPSKREIFLEKDLEPYQRDLTLFHEITHAWYEDDASDSPLSHYAYENRVIAEYLSRILRKNPELLKHTVLSFYLKHYIYDLASYQAFHPYPSNLDIQLAFPFAEEYYKNLNRILMD